MHQTEIEASAPSAFAPDTTSAQFPAPHVFIVHVTQAINDGPANVVHVLRAHDEPDAHHLTREAFPSALRIRSPHRVDTLVKLRRMSDAEAAAVVAFHVAEAAQ